MVRVSTDTLTKGTHSQYYFVFHGFHGYYSVIKSSQPTVVALPAMVCGWVWCEGICGGSHGFRGYFDTGYLWFYYFVHLWMVRVSMDSTDTLTEGTTTWMVRVSMDSMDILTEGIPWFYQPILLWMVRVSMDSADTLTQYYFVYPWMVRVSMDSIDTLTEGTPRFYYFVHPWMVRVSMDSTDTLTEGIPWFYQPILLCISLVSQNIYGFHGYFDRGYTPTLYILGKTEYQWIPWIL